MKSISHNSKISFFPLAFWFQAVVRIDVVAFGSTLAVFELMKAWRRSFHPKKNTGGNPWEFWRWFPNLETTQHFLGATLVTLVLGSVYDKKNLDVESFGILSFSGIFYSLTIYAILQIHYIHTVYRYSKGVFFDISTWWSSAFTLQQTSQCWGQHYLCIHWMQQKYSSLNPLATRVMYRVHFRLFATSGSPSLAGLTRSCKLWLVTRDFVVNQGSSPRGISFFHRL